MRKNNLAESVTFLAATVIDFLSSVKITYFKYNIYKAKKSKGILNFGVGKFMMRFEDV